jgi:hypothetical protein
VNNDHAYLCVCVAISIVLLRILAFPAIFFLDMNAMTQYVVTNVAFAVATLGVMFTVFYPKIESILNGDEVDENMNIVSRSAGAGAEVHVDRDTDSDRSKMKKTKLMFAEQVSDSKRGKDEMLDLAKTQLLQWQAEMVRMQGEGGARTSSNSHSHSHRDHL